MLLEKTTTVSDRKRVTSISSRMRKDAHIAIHLNLSNKKEHNVEGLPPKSLKKEWAPSSLKCKLEEQNWALIRVNFHVLTTRTLVLSIW